jgi:hypothetical protein
MFLDMSIRNILSQYVFLDISTYISVAKIIWRVLDMSKRRCVSRREHVNLFWPTCVLSHFQNTFFNKETSVFKLLSITSHFIHSEMIFSPERVLLFNIRLFNRIFEFWYMSNSKQRREPTLRLLHLSFLELLMQSDKATLLIVLYVKQ